MSEMPVGRIPEGKLRYLVVPALVVWAIAWLPFLLIAEAPEMIRLQFAGSEGAARAITGGWTIPQARDVAYLIGVDSVHIVAYVAVLAAGVVWASRRMRGRAAGWGPGIAWLPVAAAIFDIIENAGLIAMVRGNFDAPVPAMTMYFSYSKYLVFFLVVPYVLAGVVARLRRARA